MSHAERTSIPTSIRDVLDRYIAAVAAHDVDGLAALYSDDVRVFDSWAVFEMRGIDAWQPTIKSWLGAPDTHQSCVIEDISGFEDGDLAVASAAVQYRGINDGHEESMWNRITIVLRRIDGAWKIVHEHTSMPIDEETMQPKMDRTA